MELTFNQFKEEVVKTYDNAPVGETPAETREILKLYMESWEFQDLSTSFAPRYVAAALDLGASAELDPSGFPAIQVFRVAYLLGHEEPWRYSISDVPYSKPSRGKTAEDASRNFQAKNKNIK